MFPTTQACLHLLRPPQCANRTYQQVYTTLTDNAIVAVMLAFHVPTCFSSIEVSSSLLPSSLLVTDFPNHATRNQICFPSRKETHHKRPSHHPFS